MNYKNNMKATLEDFKAFKAKSGSHSPSIEVLREELAINILVDACFLSNPYATDLFMDHFISEIIEKDRLRDMLEFYPPQNRDIASYISRAVGAPDQNIFIANGAIELIQAILHRFVNESLCVPIPTFSSYYEFVPPGITVHRYQLKPEENYALNLDDYTRYIQANNVRNAIIINPNNPDGGYNSREMIRKFIVDNSHLDSIIIDESFIHFAYEDDSLSMTSFEDSVLNYPNVILVKSMAKDFGVAGMRVGYGLMSEERVNLLLSNGFLWNSNGMAAYFLKLYSRPDFFQKYQIVRKKYIMNTMMFMNELSQLEGYQVLPTKANFLLVRSKHGLTSEDLMSKLLFEHGIYVRDCSDKIGLEAGFVRIASRRFEDNLLIIDALKQISANKCV